MKGMTYNVEGLAYTAKKIGDPTYINCNFKYISLEILARRGFVLLKVLKLIEIPNLNSVIIPPLMLRWDSGLKPCEPVGRRPEDR